MALAVNASDGVHPNEIHAGVRAEHLWTTYQAIPFAIRYAPQNAKQGLPYTGSTPRLLKGVAPYTFSLAPSSQALPAGLTLNPASGVISGIPTQAGVSNPIRLRVTDSIGAVAESVFSLTVEEAPQIRIADYRESVNSSDSTSIPIALPEVVEGGDLLLAVLSVDGNDALTWDHSTAGAWTQVGAYVTSSLAHKLYVMAKTADGSESAKTVMASVSAAQQSVASVFRIKGATGVIQAGAYARGTDALPNPAAVTPTWAVAHMTIAAVALDGAGVLTAGPVGYEGFTSRSSSAGGQSTLGTAWKIGSGAEDPSAFTASASGQWVTATIALQAV